MSGFKAVAAAGLLVLAGCDRLGFGAPAGNQVSANQVNAVAEANQSGGKDPATGTPAASAGVTTSRSLAGLNGNSPTGGKDPTGLAGAVDPALLVGSWTDDGDCSREIVIRSDGTFRHFNGGEGEWQLDGDVLTFSGNEGSITLRVQSLDQQALVAANPDGTLGRSTRC